MTMTQRSSSTFSGRTSPMMCGGYRMGRMPRGFFCWKAAGRLNSFCSTLFYPLLMASNSSKSSDRSRVTETSPSFSWFHHNVRRSISNHSASSPTASCSSRGRTACLRGFDIFPKPNCCFSFFRSRGNEHCQAGSAPGQDRGVVRGQVVVVDLRVGYRPRISPPLHIRCCVRYYPHPDSLLFAQA